MRSKHSSGFTAALLSGLILSIFPTNGRVAAAETAKPTVKNSDMRQTPAPKEEARHNDLLGRTTPRGAVEGFIDAADARDYKRASRYLDMHGFSAEDAETRGAELAKQLKLVLDRELDLKLTEISDHPDGDLSDGMSAADEMIASFNMGGKKYDISLSRTRDAMDEKGHWVFSEATVWLIPRMYQELEYGFMQKFLSKQTLEREFIGLKLVLWIGLLVSAVFGLALAYAIIKTLSFTSRLLAPAIVLSYLKHVETPLFFFTFVLCARGIAQHFLFFSKVRALYASSTFLILVAGWLIVRSIDFFTLTMARQNEFHPILGKALALNSFNRVIKYMVVVVLLAFWLHNIGIEITTILTGLGIGGLAVALASQKSLEDLFGALTILSEKPFKIGDMIKLGDKKGEVQEIDLRYTFMRTPDRTVISIPNAQVAGMQIENLSKRDQFWYHPRLTLRYETTPAQMILVLEGIRSLLRNHPEVSENRMYVNFAALSDYSLDLEVSAYVKTRSYEAFLMVSESLNFKIMEIVAEAGAEFAFPSQTVYNG